MPIKQAHISFCKTALLGAVFVGLLSAFGSCKKGYSWREHYISDSKDPYGTYLVRQLLETYHPNQKLELLNDSIEQKLDTGTLVYIGRDFWLDSLSTIELLDFVARGNQAFIACPWLPHGLLDSIGLGECVNLEYYDEEAPVFTGSYSMRDTVGTINFSHPALADSAGYPLKFRFLKHTVEYQWFYLPQEYMCEGQTVFAKLGTLNEVHTNFVKASYGAGAFYIHTNPLAFTNFHLVEKRGLEYASKAFSHLKPGKIHWDERLPTFEDPEQGEQGGPSESPLRYVLSQPPLAWAWYIMLSMALFYIVFRAKRRQRVIPVLERNRNTSQEFISTMGRLYFLQNNHRQLAKQKMRLFLIFVRERYHIPTKELDTHFAKSLAMRSNVPEEHIGRILNLNRNIGNSGFLSEDTLVTFHRLLERFYRECR